MPRVQMAAMAQLEQRELLVRLVLQEAMVLTEQPELRVQQVPLEQREQLEATAAMVPLDQQARPEPQEVPGQLDHRESLARWERLVLKVRLARRERLVQMVLTEQREPQDQLAQQERREQLALLDPLELRVQIHWHGYGFSRHR
ncbi:MAG: hypothetical protein WAN17_15250 [Candidatus Sulfotelmatobacter sp.]